jgi:hypothetical protein
VIAVKHVSEIQVTVGDDSDAYIIIRQVNGIGEDEDAVLFYAEHVDALIAALQKAKAEALAMEASNG